MNIMASAGLTWQLRTRACESWQSPCTPDGMRSRSAGCIPSMAGISPGLTHYKPAVEVVPDEAAPAAPLGFGTAPSRAQGRAGPSQATLRGNLARRRHDSTPVSRGQDFGVTIRRRRGQSATPLGWRACQRASESTGGRLRRRA